MFSATNNMLIVKSMYYDKGIGNSDIKLTTGGVSVKNKFFTNEFVRFANVVPAAQMSQVTERHGD